MRDVRREGAGRPRGAKNKCTREVKAAMKAVAQEFAETIPDAFAGDGVSFLQTVYRIRSCRYQSDGRGGKGSEVRAPDASFEQRASDPPQRGSWQRRVAGASGRGWWRGSAGSSTLTATTPQVITGRAPWLRASSLATATTHLSTR